MVFIFRSQKQGAERPTEPDFPRGAFKAKLVRPILGTAQ
jgi:hypothetical protein